MTARVAEAIALKARPSFLVAGLEARARADDPEVIDTTVPGWAELHTFPDNVRAAMESYVSRLPDPDRAFDLLVPLAFCRGTGPSEDLWAELASAYSGRSVALAELDRLLRSVVASLVETHSAGGVLTVSLGHQALSDTLRSRTSPKLVEALFAQVLARRAATDGWLAADDYTRGHLASHAAHGGWLDALLMQEPGYLVIADPDDLLAALPNAVARDAVQAAKAYRQCAPLLRQMPDVERISQLELSAYQVGNAGLARKLAALADGRMWRTLWAHATVKGDHLIIRTREAQSVALGVLADGTYAVISGGWGKTVRVWDIETGAAIGEPLEGHSEIVWGVAFCVLRDGTPVAVSCSADQTLRTWDLRSGTARGEPLRGHEGPIASVAAGRRGDGTPVAISGGQDGTVRVWDLESGAAIGAPLRGHEGIVWSVATGFQQDGTPVIVSAGDDHTVRVWDLETGAPIREPLRGHDGTVRSVAVAERNPERGTLILSGGHDRTIRMWDLDAGLQVARAGAPGMVAAVRFGVWKDGEDVIVVAGETGDVRILGATVTELRGHEGWVHTLTMGTKRDGTPVIVSGDGDGTVRVWGIPAAQLDAVASGHVGKVNDVAFAALRDGTPIVASGGADGTIRVWNAESGATVRPPLHSPHDEVFAVAAWTRGDGTPMLVSTGFHENDRVARIWDLESGGAAGEFGRGHIGTASAIAVTASAGRPVLVAGCHDGTVCVWDLESAALTVRTPGHDGPVFAVAVGAGPDGTLLVASGGFDRTVRVWELETGEPVGDQLQGHDGLASSVAIASMRDGSRVVATTDLPGTLRLWDLGSGTLVREARSGPDRHIVTMGFAETAAGVSHLVSADSSGAVEIREIYSWTVLPAPINLGSRPTGLKIRGPRCAFSAGQGVAVLELSL